MIKLNGTPEERQAAMTVRRAINKVKMAMPGNMDTLEGELLLSFDEHRETMGSLCSQIETEVEKALETSKRRIANLLENREKLAERARRPREIMSELEQMIQDMVPRVENVRTLAGLDGGAELDLDNVEEVVNAIDTTSADIKEFYKTLVAYQNEIKASITGPGMQLSPLPEDVKKECSAFFCKAAMTKTSWDKTMLSARIATGKLGELQRKRKFDEMKGDLQRQFQDATTDMPRAHDTIAEVEEKVDPLVKNRIKDEDSAMELAQQVESSLGRCRSAIESVAQDLKSLPSQEQKSDDPQLSKMLETFVTSESKRIKVKHALLEKRVSRIDNILKRFKKEKNAVKNQALFESMKDQLLDHIKSAGDSEAMEEVEPAVKNAEQQTQVISAFRDKSVEEMEDAESGMGAAVEIAQSAIDFARQEICPIQDGVDEDVKRQLEEVAAPLLKKHTSKLWLMEKRLERSKSLWTAFKKEIEQKREARSSGTAKIVGRLLRHHMFTYDLTCDALFDKVCDDLDQGGFFAFVESLDKTVPKEQADGGKGVEETETLEVSDEALLELFDCIVSADDGGSISKEVFMKLARVKMVVAKGTTMSSEAILQQGRLVRTLKPGETVTVLEGPIYEEKAGTRVRVRADSDGKEGWASVAGTAGSVFLTES